MNTTQGNYESERKRHTLFKKLRSTKKKSADLVQIIFTYLTTFLSAQTKLKQFLLYWKHMKSKYGWRNEPVPEEAHYQIGRNGHDAELFVAPGVQRFSITRCIENLEFFHSPKSMMEHFNENEQFICAPWTDLWESLQGVGWQERSTSALLPTHHFVTSSQECNETYFIFASAEKVLGSAQRLVDGIHMFRTNRGVQLYISKFPFLLQDKITFLCTLRSHGWKVDDGDEVRVLWTSSDSVTSSDRDEWDGYKTGWLSEDETRKQLWVFPWVLFRHYAPHLKKERVIEAIRVVESLPSADVTRRNISGSMMAAAEVNTPSHCKIAPLHTSSRSNEQRKQQQQQAQQIQQRVGRGNADHHFWSERSDTPATTAITSGSGIERCPMQITGRTPGTGSSVGSVGIHELCAEYNSSHSSDHTVRDSMQHQHDPEELRSVQYTNNGTVKNRVCGESHSSPTSKQSRKSASPHRYVAGSVSSVSYDTTHHPHKRHRHSSSDSSGAGNVVTANTAPEHKLLGNISSGETNIESMGLHFSQRKLLRIDEEQQQQEKGSSADEEVGVMSVSVNSLAADMHKAHLRSIAAIVLTARDDHCPVLTVASAMTAPQPPPPQQRPISSSAAPSSRATITPVDENTLRVSKMARHLRDPQVPNWARDIIKYLLYKNEGIHK